MSRLELLVLPACPRVGRLLSIRVGGGLLMLILCRVLLSLRRLGWFRIPSLVCRNIVLIGRALFRRLWVWLRRRLLWLGVDRSLFGGCYRLLVRLLVGHRLWRRLLPRNHVILNCLLFR